jgi:hypothetical protein
MKATEAAEAHRIAHPETRLRSGSASRATMKVAETPPRKAETKPICRAISASR